MIELRLSLLPSPAPQSPGFECLVPLSTDRRGWAIGSNKRTGGAAGQILGEIAVEKTGPIRLGNRMKLHVSTASAVLSKGAHRAEAVSEHSLSDGCSVGRVDRSQRFYTTGCEGDQPGRFRAEFDEACEQLYFHERHVDGQNQQV